MFGTIGPAPEPRWCIFCLLFCTTGVYGNVVTLFSVPLWIRVGCGRSISCFSFSGSVHRLERLLWRSLALCPSVDDHEKHLGFMETNSHFGFDGCFHGNTSGWICMDHFGLFLSLKKDIFSKECFFSITDLRSVHTHTQTDLCSVYTHINWPEFDPHT